MTAAVKYLWLPICAALIGFCGCYGGGIGGAGWDDPGSVEKANNFSTTKSDRVTVTKTETPYGSFKQEFDTVFADFPFKSAPLMQEGKADIPGTGYSFSYEKFVLKIFHGETVIEERKLPRIFYMHAMNAGVIRGNSEEEDIILCQTISRATTGLHYIGIFDSTGEILYETVISAGDAWDITPGKEREIIIGGARSKTVVTIGPKTGIR